MKEWTLQELDNMITQLKKQQYKDDRACSFGREEEVCGQCRYVAGFWGDVKVYLEWIPE